MQHFKHFLKSGTVRALLISLITALVTIAVIGAVLYSYRAQIFKVLAANYAAQQQALLALQKPAPLAQVPEVKTDMIPSPLALEAPIVVAEPETVVTAVKKAKPAVVSIIVSKEVPKYEISYQQQETGIPGVFFQNPVYVPNGTEKKQIGSGSGFLISADGVIVTNRHVVSDTSALYEVQLNSGKKYTAKVLARDTVFDVALIKITASNLPYIELGDSDTLDVGQSVVAIGNALGEFKNTVSAGVVSGLSRSLIAGDNAGSSERLEKVIQTDAAINPGNSGGPLLNLSGDVVGINVAVVQGSSNIGFALPINSVKSIINSVRKTGKIVYPYVGIRYVSINAAVKAKYGLSVDYGVLVERGKNPGELAVGVGSPAEKAGIVEGDIILSIDGQNIDKDHDFAYLIRDKKIGDTVRLRILSKGVEKTISVRLQQAPTNP